MNKKVGELPNEKSKVFAFLSSFLPDHRGQNADTFVTKVEASDPHEIIARAESVSEQDLVSGQRETFARVLRIAKQHINNI